MQKEERKFKNTSFVFLCFFFLGGKLFMIDRPAHLIASINIVLTGAHTIHRAVDSQGKLNFP